MNIFSKVMFGYFCTCLVVAFLSYNAHQSAGDGNSFADCFGSVFIVLPLMLAAALTVFAPFVYPLLALAAASYFWGRPNTNQPTPKPPQKEPPISHHYHFYTQPKPNHFGKRTSYRSNRGPRPGWRDITPRNKRIT